MLLIACYCLLTFPLIAGPVGLVALVALVASVVVALD